MALRSMTGFAQSSGTSDDGQARWTWDIKTVNAKGLDLRLRVPAGFERIEMDARRAIGARLSRGTCHATLGVVRPARPATFRIDTERLSSLLATLGTVALPAAVGPATLDGLLGLRGIVETEDAEPDTADHDRLATACAAGLTAALDALVAMRETEGGKLHLVLGERLDAIERLTRAADAAPQRRPEAVQAKLAQSIAALSARHGLDPDRLHQEALLLAAKADVREELDRLAAHASAARALLAAGGPVGRRLDFLAQELGREASTFCAKANDAALTAIGLELRVEIEQLREQVQNIE